MDEPLRVFTHADLRRARAEAAAFSFVHGLVWGAVLWVYFGGGW